MKKKFYIPLVLLAGWYAFVLCLPEIADGHGTPAWEMFVQANMRNLAASGKPYGEAQIIVSSLRWSGQGVMYTPELTREGDESWVLVVQPDNPRKYARGFIGRLVWLDFYQHTIHTYRIRPGMEYPERVEGEQERVSPDIRDPRLGNCRLVGLTRS